MSQLVKNLRYQFIIAAWTAEGVKGIIQLDKNCFRELGALVSL